MMKFKERRAVQIGTEAFVTAEVSAEETVLLSADCLVKLLEQRRAGGFKPETGADALIHLGRGVAAASEALAEFSKAHPLLRAIPAKMDEDVPGYGTTPTEAAVPFANKPALRVADAA